MQIRDRIEALLQERKEKVASMEAMVTKSDDEGRAFTEDEQAIHDETKAAVEAIDSRLTVLEDQEKIHAVKHAVPVSKASMVETVELPNADPSLFFAKQVHCLYNGGGTRRGAAEHAEEVWGDGLMSKVFRLPQGKIKQAMQAAIVNKANPGVGDSTTTGWAAELVQVYQATEAYIDALRNASVVARFPGMQMSFQGNGSIKIPRNAGPSTGTWVGEKSAIKVDAIAFDDVTLAPLKSANIITATNELLMRSDPSALAIIRDDIVNGVATAIDTTFCSNSAAVPGVSPAGLQTFDSSPDTSTGSTLDQITQDLRGLVDQLLALNMPMTRPIWIMNPVNVNFLRFIRDGLGTYAFRTEIAGGTIFGYPFIESNSMAKTEIILTDASQVIVATEMAPMISISEDASLHMEDTSPSDDIGGATTPVYSMFQLDSVAIRVIQTLDWNVRHADSVAVLDTVAWS